MIGSMNLALDEGQAKQGDRFGRVSELYYDIDAGAFSGIVRQVARGNMVTTPIQLEPELRTIKVLASTIDGWLFGPEMEILYKNAQEVPADQVIVEVGSYCGRSTVCLGWGSRMGNRALVYAIDPHTGSKEHQAYMAGSLGSLPYFQANMRRANLEDLVVALVMNSEQAVAHVCEPIGLLFIDGDHETTHRDIELWYDKVVTGGKILFHDSVGGNWPSVETDVQTAVDAGLIRVLAQAATVTVTEKTGGQA